MTRPDRGRNARHRIGARFDAADDYDTAASVQRLTARRLMTRIRSAFGEHAPARILEFGCGTGALTALLCETWPEADITATDIAPGMLARAQARCGKGVTFVRMDMAEPEKATAVQGPFDLICGNLALQWAESREKVLSALAGLLAPSGVLAVSTLASESFTEWKVAHEAENVSAGIRLYPTLQTLAESWPERSSCLAGRWLSETLIEQPESGLAFLRGLRRIGATEPLPGSRPLTPGVMRRVLRRFDKNGASITWEIAYGLFRTPPGPGVFVTGTDTGVGKTIVSACLVRAWQASYWKPLQTGLADEDGDTPEIERLTGAAPERIFPPADTFLAPLSPEAAARAEGRHVDLSRLVLPEANGTRPLVVEGAGGLLVPVTSPVATTGQPGMMTPEVMMPGLMMIDIIGRCGLPVVLVARSGLGTLNHTLLSLAALRERGLAVLGVVLNGPLNPDNRRAIEEHGRVRVLAELPHMPRMTPEAIDRLARLLPDWKTLTP
ncbi:dethiobiotin synthase [Acetobacter musti]|uniref:ATP-dependent dethiobiotin synthetase BioD n=1 Tax=Acetobacter musti TaxID=864732 RepID=A0ABX0JKJ6_9PROT|nr:dethiobiotin synthase [Acetobacter musti]NHN83046.1 dethiobiotin synthase [Acetobacter musti]